MDIFERKITVIGDGGWGTTIAILLAKKGYSVKLWGPFPDYIRRISKNRYNNKFLPGIRLPKNIELTEKLPEALRSAEIIVFAIPSKFSQSILKKIKKTNINLSKKIILNVTKGFNASSKERISQIIQNELGENIPLAVLSGPNIAREVAAGIPSTAVIASNDRKRNKILQEIFNTQTFRIYTNTDVIGVELGGSLKNVIALACGVCDGLGFGANTKSAIVTRGLAEMTRMGKALGAKNKTFAGLSGLGDLVTTCFSPQSRNRSVGELLGKGKTIDQIMKSMEMVAEGVETVKTVKQLSEELDISMPITEQVYQIIYKKKSAAQAVEDLMTRNTKSE